MTRGGRRRPRGGLAPLVAALALATPATGVAQVADSQIFTFFEVERLEHRWNDGANSVDLDAEGWIGGDSDKLWIKADVEKVIDGPFETVEVQVLYSRLIAPAWDLQTGTRYDGRPDPSRGFAVLGVKGLAPYFFEVDAAVFLSDDGDLSARIEAEYELLFTQRLIAEPRLEINVAAREERALAIGRGLNDLELGLRVRYEIVREFAPYLGLAWERKFATTADLAQDVDNLAFVAGVRFWF